MGGDHMVAAAAKVSTNGEDALQWADPSKAEEVGGLINYLMKHRHGTPFEHSALTFFVSAPIFVWREWHRHRIGFSYNEESGRYKTLEPVFYVPPIDRPMFKTGGDWKPGRPKFLTIDQYNYETDGGTSINHPTTTVPGLSGEELYDRLCKNLSESYELAYAKYLDNLSMGFDPGLARDCLPVGIYSSCWVTCNPRSLMSFLSLRTHDLEASFVSYPLYEIEVAAQACEQLLKAGWPLTHKAFVKNGRVGP
jgi:thymidylate synthase (FAD)